LIQRSGWVQEASLNGKTVWMDLRERVVGVVEREGLSPRQELLRV
jgi:hypothetical protein